MERMTDVLKDRHHGVLVAGVQLITAVVESNPKVWGVVVLKCWVLDVDILRVIGYLILDIEILDT